MSRLPLGFFFRLPDLQSNPPELDALGDDFAEEEQGIPSYLREDAVGDLPDFVDEPAKEEVRLLFGFRFPAFQC